MMAICIIIMSNAALLDWLQDRKKLRNDWYNYLKAAEEKLKALLKDRDWTINYPAIHDYINLHQHSFNYQDVVALVDLLLQTDLASQKNLIFGYSDKRVKEWTTLKKYMEGNSLNLLSLAKFIGQSLRFDLPGLSKSVEGFDNQLATLRRKIDFNNNTIFQQRAAQTKEKALLGMETSSEMLIESIVEQLIGRGPEQIKNLETIVQSEQIRGYLADYNSINTHNQTPNPLPALEYFIEHGDEFLEVYQDPSKKQQFLAVKKYKQFQSWKGSNEWQIEVQGEQKHEQRVINYSTVIESREFRQQLLYNLSQLLFFYKGLKYQLTTAEKSIGFQTQNSRHSSIAEGDANTAIIEIEKVLSYLTSKRLIAPLQLKNSKKAYQVLVGQFLGYQANIATMQSQIRLYRQQIVQLQKKRGQQVQKLNWLRAKVVGCKSRCEQLLSQLIKKEVRITGEINKLQ